MSRKEMNLGQLFSASAEIGDKYLSKDEVETHQAEMDAVMEEIKRDAAARGEYDYKKDLWLL